MRQILCDYIYDNIHLILLDINDHSTKKIQALAKKGNLSSNLKIKRKLLNICFMRISYITSFATFLGIQS